MKTKLDCIPCFQRQALEAARMVTEDEGEQERVMREVMSALERMDWREKQLLISKKVHGIVAEELGVRDPYKRAKEESNKKALALYPELKRLVLNSEDRMATAIKISIAGNAIDFGPENRIGIEEAIERAIGMELDGTYDEFLRELDRADWVLFFADNCGEIVFDRPLLEMLNKRVRFVVKKEPILNDATAEDAVKADIRSIKDIEIAEIETGENESFLEKGTLVISKGQGNYEALSERRGIYFMLMAKCPLIAEDLGVDVGSAVFRRS
jgi:hypothetical protein